MTSTRSSALLAKAERTLRGARLLCDVDDADGACSRAYYAMFDAARAALLATGDNGETSTKTHRGLIAAFGQKLVLAEFTDRKYNRSLNRVHELRLLADYLGDPVTPDQAAWAVSQAEDFVAEMQRIVAATS